MRSFGQSSNELNLLQNTVHDNKNNLTKVFFKR